MSTKPMAERSALGSEKNKNRKEQRPNFGSHELRISGHKLMAKTRTRRVSMGER